MKGFIEVTMKCDNIKQKIHYSQLKFKSDGSVKLHGRILKQSYERIKQLIKDAL